MIELLEVYLHSQEKPLMLMPGNFQIGPNGVQWRVPSGRVWHLAPWNTIKNVSAHTQKNVLNAPNLSGA